MLHRVLLALLVLAPAAARADAIMPFDGACFPGARRGISNHAEACIPIECQSDADCGDGARCQTLCTCRAEREFRGEGRVIYPEPVTRVVEVGFCDPDGRCAEGDRSDRRQCEPVDDTPAFDRASHRWTGQPHVASSGEGEGEDDDDAPPGEASPTGGSCAGCAVPRARTAGGIGLLLVLLGLAATRRR